MPYSNWVLSIGAAVVVVAIPASSRTATARLLSTFFIIVIPLIASLSVTFAVLVVIMITPPYFGSRVWQSMHMIGCVPWMELSSQWTGYLSTRPFSQRWQEIRQVRAGWVISSG